ncbi:MAG TPA: hypothetical protein VKB84_15875 [Candidatus Binataceae bacterium]|jgi:hypothetical protein|nr:hypothetical protein [Candidatus Binataceae bacterium]
MLAGALHAPGFESKRVETAAINQLMHAAFRSTLLYFKVMAAGRRRQEFFFANATPFPDCAYARCLSAFAPDLAYLSPVQGNILDVDAKWPASLKENRSNLDVTLKT